MAGLNRALLIGHVGADPEIRTGQDGRQMATFSLATGESWKDKTTGERKEKTEWHNIVVFNEALVRVAEQYVKKGSKLYIEGQIRTRKWTDQAGVDRWRTEVILSAFQAQIILLDRAERAPAADDSSYRRDSAGAAATAHANAATGRREIDDEIPF